MMKRQLSLLIGIVILTLSGCAPAIYKLYPSDLPKEHIALLLGDSPYLSIMWIARDSHLLHHWKQKRGLHSGSEYQLSAGEYKLEVMYIKPVGIYGHHEVSISRFHFKADAGHTYRAKYEKYKADKEDKVRIWIEDVATGRIASKGYIIGDGLPMGPIATFDKFDEFDVGKKPEVDVKMEVKDGEIITKKYIKEMGYLYEQTIYETTGHFFSDVPREITRYINVLDGIELRNPISVTADYLNNIHYNVPAEGVLTKDIVTIKIGEAHITQELRLTRTQGGVKWATTAPIRVINVRSEDYTYPSGTLLTCDSKNNQCIIINEQ